MKELSMRAPYKLGGLVNYFFLFRFLLRRFSRAGPWSHFLPADTCVLRKKERKKNISPFFYGSKEKEDGEKAAAAAVTRAAVKS